MTQPTEIYKPCECKHDRHSSQSAVWYDSTGWLYCISCKGWQRIKHRITVPTNGSLQSGDK